MTFLREILSDTGNASSKRLAGLWALLIVTVMIIGDQFSKFKLNSEALWLLLGFILTCFGLNAYLQAKGMTAKKDLASDIITQTGDSQDAKEVLQSEKP